MRNLEELRTHLKLPQQQPAQQQSAQLLPQQQPAQEQLANIISLVADIGNGNDEQKETAARALGKLALDDAKNSVAIREANGVPPLVTLLSKGTKGQKECAVRALRWLALDATNSVAIGQAGGIEPLVALVSEGSKDQKEKAVDALRDLAKDTTNKAIIIDTLPADLVVARLTVPEIKFLLKCFDQTVGGKRDVLVERLRQQIEKHQNGLGQTQPTPEDCIAQMGRQPDEVQLAAAKAKEDACRKAAESAAAKAAQEAAATTQLVIVQGPAVTSAQTSSEHAKLLRAMAPDLQQVSHFSCTLCFTVLCETANSRILSATRDRQELDRFLPDPLFVNTCW